MVKFKNLLLEDKELKTLQELKEREEWVFNNPPFYRGKYSREDQDQIEFKTLPNEGGRKTRRSLLILYFMVFLSLALRSFLTEEQADLLPLLKVKRKNMEIRFLLLFLTKVRM